MTTQKSRLELMPSVMRMCKLWADMRSKDPSTKVGAAIYDGATGGLSLGYNGFPAGMPEDSDWWNTRIGTVCNEPEDMTEVYQLTKYDLVIHAEVNAARKALMAGVNLRDASSILVCTHIPCPQCFKDVVLANRMQTVLYATDNYASRSPRDGWLLKQLADLGGVNLVKMEEE